MSKKPKLTGAALRRPEASSSRLPAFAQSGVKLSYSWYANGKRIKKQIKSSLKLTKALKGKRITVKITVTKAGYKTLTLTVKLGGKVKAR